MPSKQMNERCYMQSTTKTKWNEVGPVKVDAWCSTRQEDNETNRTEKTGALLIKFKYSFTKKSFTTSEQIAEASVEIERQAVCRAST